MGYIPYHRQRRDQKLIRKQRVRVGDICLVKGVWRPAGEAMHKEFKALMIYMGECEWYSLSSTHGNALPLPPIMTHFERLEEDRWPKAACAVRAKLILEGRLRTRD